MNKTFEAVNWNVKNDDLTQAFFEQNLSQMWTPDEIPVSKDIECWNMLKPEEKDTFKKVLVFLTLLDTQQGCENLPSINFFVKDLQQKAVLSFMEMMEHIHAKSYSTIFMTILSNEEIEKLFTFARENELIQEKAKTINYYLEKLKNLNASQVDIYLAMIASCFLEYFLFYTGFFYPIYLSSSGKMTASGEIISLIIRDEVLHGAFTSMLANNIYKNLSDSDREVVDKEFFILFDKLWELETEWTKYLFKPLNLENDVLDYMKYNANRTLKLFKKPEKFENVSINPLIIKAIKKTNYHHDFFSTKGNTYVKHIEKKNENLSSNIENDDLFDF
ncbi:ribonucleotide-diphosphate reductase subunit beta [symbiont of Argiope bruennichi]|uniref:ribonucleotide-diphosphate reductase subunit beta n=1 Tax=symbiont of Argiope bruennichi TaxID=2810479 RepID=UPI003DA26B69